MNQKESKLLTDHYHALSKQAGKSWQAGNFQEAAKLYQHESTTRQVVTNMHNQAGIPDKGNHNKAIVYSATLALMAGIEAKNKKS